MKKFSFYLFIILLTNINLYAQSFLHTEGKNIVNGEGGNVILRGIGTGNWMIQEGYMMQSSDVAGTQHEFRKKLIQTIGASKTDSFYSVWLNSYMQKADIDSMKAWGFNSIRPALHYVWFTPPIEEEPIPGEITWIEKGFQLLDSLVKWCNENEMYVILDMHGTPGGQGKDANISDYDPSKPSLWESQANKDKLTALWVKLAERYKDEEWVGGYDLINEPNWDFGDNNHTAMWDLYKTLTHAVRDVDTNHIIFVEGNWFANNYNGLPEIWDDNLVLSFHKYWNYNYQGSINWMIDLRNERNVPIWLGETGENSNTWFTNLVQLAEKNNIGWSWWPLKKAGINNVLKVKTPAKYAQLMNSWKGEAAAPSVEESFQAVLDYAKNQHIENCEVGTDVIDALIRQPSDYTAKPFKKHDLKSEIFCVDYDLGRNKIAYYDTDTANYRLETGSFTNWNTGWNYRNDGVDIEPCNDTYGNNGYNVGWIADGEWLIFTLETDSTASYFLEIRSASETAGGIIQLELDEEPLISNIHLPVTGGWTTWQSTYVNDVVIPGGKHQLKLKVEKGGMNLNFMNFTNPTAVTSKPLMHDTSLEAVLYPNPTKDSFFLDLKKEKDCNLAIFNSYGQQMKGYTNYQSGKKINVSEFAQGLYFVEIKKLDGRSVTKKIFVKK